MVLKKVRGCCQCESSGRLKCLNSTQEFQSELALTMKCESWPVDRLAKTFCNILSNSNQRRLREKFLNRHQEKSLKLELLVLFKNPLPPLLITETRSVAKECPGSLCDRSTGEHNLVQRKSMRLRLSVFQRNLWKKALNSPMDNFLKNREFECRRMHWENSQEWQEVAFFPYLLIIYGFTVEQHGCPLLFLKESS